MQLGQSLQRLIAGHDAPAADLMMVKAVAVAEMKKGLVAEREKGAAAERMQGDVVERMQGNAAGLKKDVAAVELLAWLDELAEQYLTFAATTGHLLGV